MYASGSGWGEVGAAVRVRQETDGEVFFFGRLSFMPLVVFHYSVLP